MPIEQERMVKRQLSRTTDGLRSQLNKQHWTSVVRSRCWACWPEITPTLSDIMERHIKDTIDSKVDIVHRRLTKLQRRGDTPRSTRFTYTQCRRKPQSEQRRKWLAKFTVRGYLSTRTRTEPEPEPEPEPEASV